MKLDLTCPIASAPKEQKTEKDEKKGINFTFSFWKNFLRELFFSYLLSRKKLLGEHTSKWSRHRKQSEPCLLSYPRDTMAPFPNTFPVPACFLGHCLGTFLGTLPGGHCDLGGRFLKTLLEVTELF